MVNINPAAIKKYQATIKTTGPPMERLWKMSTADDE